MEAVPKLPLISFELKVSPEYTHFGPKLKQYIAEAYREDAESYSNEIHQLEGLRSAAVRPTTDSTGLSALYRYFCQLRSVQSRFPMAKGQPAACTFSWKDLYANMTTSLADIRVEMACILYNIGALHTQLGSSEPRNTAESLKAACTHYQNAAWAFQYLKEQYPQPPGVDMFTEIMRLFQKICFAQAQECILEKSIQDTRKPSVIGAVATQVLMFYKNALSLLGPSTGTDNIHEIIGTKLYNYWYRFLSFKSFYIGCIVCLYQGINAEEQQKMGERVAFYQQAVDRLAEARKLAKYIEPTQVTQEALTFTNDVVEGKRKAAKNENEFIYHEEVPEKDLLMEMKPVCLVKAIPINFNDPEISGPDLFSRLVPICAHEASSLYSEEKAKLLRSIVSQAEAKNTELTEFMSSLQLDQLEVIDSEQKVPQEIVDRCAAMNAKTEIIQSLVDSMNNLAEIISDVEHSLIEIKTLIQEETMKEKEYQKTMGPRPPSIVQTELSREYHKYHEAHTRTNESNQVLHKAMTLHIANLKLLAQPLDVLQCKIPSIDCIEGLDRDTMAEMRRVVGKAREMQTQRDSLIQQLREAITSDDITSQLLARSAENTDDIFKQELEKHTPRVKIIEQNLAAQENIINKLTSLYASYGESRRLLSDVLRKREGLINALITSYDTYEELLGKAQKGMEFYKKLSHNVNQLLTRLKGTCQVQEEERMQLLAKNSKPSTPTPSVPSKNDVTAPIPSIPVVGGGRKLKDYLPYMQTRGRRSGTPQAQVEPMPVEMYYPESIYPTSVRPTPVGSEATDIPMQLSDGGIMPMQGQSNPYDRYASPYVSSESDSYASQQNYAYPATSKDYEKPDMNPYGYSAYIPQQFASQVPDQSQQIYSHPYYSATHNNGTIVTDSQSAVQQPTGVNQPNMSQPNMSQANMSQPNMSQANVPNQYANNPNEASASSNQYNNPSNNQANANPNQFAYDPYMSTSMANPIPDTSLAGYSANQPDLNTNFSQMQIAAPKSETSTSLGDYAQTYYSVQYPQSNTPNFSTYSHAPQPAKTSSVAAPSDYSSLNYPYSSDSSQYGQTPSTSVPYSADQQYYATTGYANVSQGYPTYTQADNSVTSTTSFADTATVSQPFSYPGSDPNYVNPSLSHLDALDKPIKSHVKREALSSNSYAPSFQTTPQAFTNPNDHSNIQNVPTSQMYANPSDQNKIQNVSTPQLYANPNNPSNVQNVQTPQMYASQNNPSNIHNVQTPQMYANSNNPSNIQNVQTPQMYANPNDPNNIQNVQAPQMYANPNNPSNIQNPQTPQMYANPNDPSNIQNAQTPQMYSNPNDQSNIQNAQTPQMYSNPNGPSNIQNVQAPQAYANPNSSNIQNAQTPQMYSNPSNPGGTQNTQTSQVYTNPNDQSYQPTSNPNQNFAQGYQNHPGYTFDTATGNYAYAYGSQNSISYDANVTPQASGKDQNWSAQGVYTSAGTCATVQSPSLETPPTQPEQPINQQIYYNSPYGYNTNTSQTNQVVQNSQSAPTNYGADLNQSTYMQSGQQGHDTSVTFANNQVSTPKENVTEPPNFDQSRHSGYNVTHDPQTHDQNIKEPSNADYGHDQNVSNVEKNITDQTSNQNVGSGQATDQNTVDSQNTSNQVPIQNKPVPEQPANIPETKSEPSVFDLLSDIDFTVEQKPLMPEIKVPQISESAIKRPASMPKVEPIKKPPPKEEVIERPAKRDLFSDPSLLNKFTQEVKNLQKLTDSLTDVTAGGLTILDSKWKTFQDVQNKENMSRSKTVARQHSTSNIVTEVVPFDDSRLTLKSDPDAYINASYYKQLAPWCIPLVISKNPTENEYGIFWKAVLENKISCVVCLLSEIEMQGKSYWPTAKGQSLELSGGLKVTLDEVTCNVHWTERKLTVASGKTVLGVTHYQINVFPAKIVCSPLVLLVDKILSQTYENRLSNQLSGAWVQCGAGAGRSALLALLIMMLCQVRAGQLELCDMLDAGCIDLIKNRSNVLEDTKYLADAYRTALFYVQGVLCSGTTAFNGEAVSLPSGASVLPPVTPSSTPSLQKQKFSRESFEEMKQSPGLKSGDMKDPLNFLDPLWSLKKK